MLLKNPPAIPYGDFWLSPWEQREVIDAMLHWNIIQQSNTRNLPLKNGGKTDIYVNLRQARNYPEALRYFANIFCNPIERLRAHRFAEVPQAVSCFAGLMAERLNLPMVTIRDKPKAGRVSDANIIGEINRGDIVPLFDDVITDGQSKVAGFRAITARGAMPYLIVMVDRQQGWMANLAEQNIFTPVWSGMTLHDIRQRLVYDGVMERCSYEAEAANKVILALDGKSWAEILPIVDQLRTTGTILKVGDMAAGDGLDTVLPRLQTYGRVMVDLKPHDVPSTVANVCGRIAKHNPWASTFHASGGKVMAKTVIDAFAGCDTIPLAVTLLTSLDKEGEEIYQRLPLDQVMFFAKQMWEVGIRGFVCSPHEAPALRQKYDEALIVTPGVRSKGVAKGTQKRVATPEQAIANGADYVVGGTQFLTAQDPAAEVARVNADIKQKAT